jgi:hypothetical protein
LEARFKRRPSRVGKLQEWTCRPELRFGC